jgi:hypothetical protein
MIFLTVLVTGQEWAKLRDAAKEQFPNKILGRGDHPALRDGRNRGDQASDGKGSGAAGVGAAIDAVCGRSRGR